jgi:high-affinity nickel-transport protein
MKERGDGEQLAVSAPATLQSESGRDQGDEVGQTTDRTPPRPGRLRGLWASLGAAERRSVLAMAGVIVALHLAGFAIVVGLVAPHHYALGASGAFTVGLGITAWTLGLRHAFDADHISAIDNTTRKLMHEGRRPLSVGFWFSLGHSTIVFALAFLLAMGLRALAGPVKDSGSGLHAVTGWIGTLVSGSFLYVIAALNLAILVGIVSIFRQMRAGQFDEAALERKLAARGFFNRFLGRLARSVSSPRQMYPVGVLFGLGFDTATEVALLVIAGTAGAAGLPFYAVLSLPLLFAGGMCLADTLDGTLMNVAYDWAFSTPVRKVFYNLAITGLSVAVASAIGTIELSGLVFQKLDLSGGFWTWWESIDINLLGFVIVGLFVLVWAVALGYWRLARVEERFGERLLRRSDSAEASEAPGVPSALAATSIRP